MFSIIKKIKKHIYLLPFVIVAVLDIYAVGFSIRELEVWVKPMIIPTLFFYYILCVRRVNYWYIGALSFSFIGDLFLLNEDNYFLFGVLVFLIVHLIYMKIFFDFLKRVSLKRSVKPYLISLAVLSVIVFFIAYFTGNILGFLFIYGLVLIVSALLTYLNLFYGKRKGDFLLFLGAFIFVTSNSFIALNMFYVDKIVFMSIMNMLLYILAQYFICLSMIYKQFGR